MTRRNEMTDPIGLRRGLTHYGDADFALYLRRSFARSMGYSTTLLDRPVIGIANTSSGFNNCHRMVPDLVEAVARRVPAAGALPRDFPLTQLRQPLVHRATPMFPDLSAVDTQDK